ncbi:hypothetical protein [Paenarthrobacter sp. JL.01a]|uniref:hypothetical protein n=1 Tax=Paenarthrobacter sp. JL.01a TaxID=2979324 RepID=UPI0021C9D4A2|nr:hypothetical protein [Paenarthrobacter sp. JL.01a]UXM92421.1 hypothetical protein N5P29_03605 [Paenarthrobacter sp. JL.01a]
MGNSGKLAVVSAFVALALLVLAAVVLEELVLYLFLGSVLLCYLASLVQLFNRRRYFVILLGAVGTSLFIGCSIAFLRMWGIAFTQDANALGGAVGTGSAISTKDSDIYFYLAVAAGLGTLAVMFLGAVVPSFGSRAAAPVKRPAPAPKRAPAQRKSPPRPAGQQRPGAQAQRPVKRPATPAPKRPAPQATPAKRPAPRTPATPAKRPASSVPTQRKPAPKR